MQSALFAASALGLFDLGVRSGSGATLIGSGFLFYVITAFSLMRIAKRTRYADDALLAWVPILNLLLMLKIAGRPAWWILLFLSGCLSPIVWVVIWLDIAKALGKGAGLGLLAGLFPIVGLPLLALSSDR